MKILIVEDDAFLSKMYAKKFEIAGFNVSVAHDGVEGFEKAKTFLPDLILMDILMPKQNGIETLDKLKAEVSTKDIPVVMATNLSTTDDADTAIQKGAAKYVVKSEVTPSQMVALVSEVLKL